MKLEFGKKVIVGNYYVLKYGKNLSKSELKELRNKDRVPREVRDCLQRRTLPYIKVGTTSGSWAVEFVMGTTMYNALDALHVVVDDEGVRQLYGVEKKNTEAIFVSMMADTTTVGDYEYQVAKMKLLSEYLNRASKKKNEEADAGKSEDELKKESEDAVQEVIDRDNAKTVLLHAAEEIKKGE